MHARAKLAAVPLTAALLGFLAVSPPASAAKNIELISQSPTGEVAKHGANWATLSATGRYITFDSFADNLVPRSPSSWSQVFLKDRQTGDIELISLNDNGAESNSYTGGRSVSADGRYVTFETNATNLASGVSGRYNHVYLRDRQTRKTTLISVDVDGKPLEGYNQMSTISDDGRFVVFASFGKNVVPGDTNNVSDVFVRDLAAGTTERVSLGVDNAQRTLTSTLPTISADGRFVTFVGELTSGHSDAQALFLRDRQAGTTEEVSLDSSGERPARPWIDGPAPVSADGRYVSFNSRSDDFVPDDTNGRADIFLRDRVAGTTQRISHNPDGSQTTKPAESLSMSSDGRHIAFAREAGWSPHGFRASEVFIWNMRTDAVRRISNDGNAVTTSNQPRISDDGKTIAFQSFYAFTENDTNKDMDVYVRVL